MKLKYKGKLFDTKKLYKYSRRYNHDGKEMKRILLLRLELRTYNDGERYGTSEHYGYIFIIDKIIKKYYNIRVGDECGTLPDLYERVEVEE